MSTHLSRQRADTTPCNPDGDVLARPWDESLITAAKAALPGVFGKMSAKAIPGTNERSTLYNDLLAKMIESGNVDSAVRWAIHELHDENRLMVWLAIGGAPLVLSHRGRGRAPAPSSDDYVYDYDLGNATIESTPALWEVPWIPPTNAAEQAGGAKGTDDASAESPTPGKLKPSETRYYGMYLDAIERAPHLDGSSSRDVYAWLKENLDEDSHGTLPSYSTFKSALSKARKAHGRSVNAPRAGRTGRSVVRPNDLDSAR